jgi:hypothetical protein
LAQSKNPGQAQKELFHNEALQMLDIAVAAAVEELPLNDPPAQPGAGSSYLVGDSPTGEWSQYPGHIAGYGEAGWRFIAPRNGLTVFVRASQTFAIYNSASWEAGIVRASSLVIEGQQVLGPRLPGIADPTGGTTIDAEVRSAVDQILGILRQHGLISA